MIARRLLTILPAIVLPDAAHAAALVASAGDFSPWRIVGSLLLCLALGATGIFILRKRYGLGPLTRPSAAVRSLRIAEQQGLGPSRSIALIEVDGRRYLALVAPGAAALLPLDEPIATMPEASPA